MNGHFILACALPLRQKSQFTKIMSIIIKSIQNMILYVREFLNAGGFANSPGVNQVEGLPSVPIDDLLSFQI
jgi:hypothetical protein